jgi:hypothetical protein
VNTGACAAAPPQPAATMALDIARVADNILNPVERNMGMTF